MTEVCISRHFQWKPELTSKVRKVMNMFGVDKQRLKAGMEHKLKIDIRKGDICFLTGPSGGGKSVLLNELYNHFQHAGALKLQDIKPPRMSLIDCVKGDLQSCLQTLSRAGLSEVFAMLNKPQNLSEGQRYRLHLAMAVTEDAEYVFADEFCSNLDRITAAQVASRVRRVADQTGKTFFLATSHDDILCDLLPDIVVIKHLNGQAEVIYKDASRNK